MCDMTNYHPKKSSESRMRIFLKDIWALSGLLIVMVTYVLVCYLAAFDNRINENITPLVVLYICDLLYLIDTTWRIASFKKKKGKTKVEKKKKIFKTILTIIDILSLIPIEVSVLIYKFHQHHKMTKTYLLAFAVMRLNRVFRLYRVRTYYSGKSQELRFNVYRREIFATFVCFLCFLIILFHGLASIWYLLNCEPVWENKVPFCYGEMDMTMLSYQNTLTSSHPYYSHVNQTIGDAFGWYIGAIHWTVMSLRNSGNRYTPPDKSTDMVISSLIMLFGYMTCMIITVFLIYILNELDLRRSMFFHEAYAVKSFVKHFDMLKSLGSFSDSCFNFMWRRKRGYSDHQMKQILPKAVQREIGMCMIQSMLETSELLRCLPVDVVESISLEAMSNKGIYTYNLKHFFPNEFLIRPNTMVQSAFFIVSGKVEILSDFDGVSPILMVTKGTMIAERNLLYPSVRRHGVKTRTACDILVVHSHTITRLITEHPTAHAKMNAILKQRAIWIKTKKHEREMESQDQNQLNEKTFKNDTEALKIPLKKKPMTAAKATETARQTTGTQFMSVLAWLSFLKDVRRSKKKVCMQYEYMYEYLQYKWRNLASIRMYKIIPLDDTPNYIFRRCVISKDSYVYHIWEMFIMIFVLVSCFLYPLELAFNSPTFCKPINLTRDVIYIIDLILRLFIFYDTEEMSPLVSILSHLLHEIRMPNIIVDVIPCLPLYLLSEAINMPYRDQNHLRIHSNIKFVRVIMMFSKFENDVRVRMFTVRFFKNLIYISLYIVWVASVFFILGCSKYPACHGNKERTWVPFSTKDSNHTQSVYHFVPYKDSVFALSLYWAICTTFGIGFNDISLQTRSETAAHSLGPLLGFCLLSYFYADLASTLSGALENAIHHQDNVVWLTRYLNDALIDLRLIDRVNHYLNVQWQVLRGISSEAHRGQGFLTVSHSMYMELVVDYVADYLYKTDLFKHLDTNTMRKFCLAAKLAVVPPNEVIVSNGDFIRRMYVIRRGYAQTYLGESSTTLGVLKPGNSFGELNMFFNVPSRISLRSITYLEVIILDNVTFDRILPSTNAFSEAIHSLRSDSDGRVDFQNKFILHKDMREKRRKRSSRQPEQTSTFVYKKAIKNTKGEIVHLRQLSNNPYDSEFNKLKMFRFLRFFFMPLTFLPKGSFIRCWEVFRVISLSFSAVLIPIVEAFPNVKNELEHYVYILDLISLIDMYIRLHTAYRDPRTNDLVTHPLLAAKNYLRSAFFIDVLGSLPVYFIINLCVSLLGYEAKVWAYLLKLNRLILLYRVHGYYKFKSMKIVKGNTWKLIRLLPLLAYQAHFLGCILALSTCPATQNNPNPEPRCKNNSWIMQSKSPRLASSTQLKDPDIYVMSFYYIATMSMGCGFGDFYPYNQDERILAFIIFFLYIFLRAYILASVVGSKRHMDHKLLGYQKHMNYLVGFLARERLESKLTSRIIRYYEYQWLRTHGIDPHMLFANLFPSLRKEVAMDVFEDALRQLPELKRVPSSFLRAICVYLTPIYFLRHDIIVQKDDICDNIYFISRGRVLEWREKGEVHLDVGDYIGVMDMNTIRPTYKYTAAAVTNVDIFGLRRHDFLRIVANYPHIAKRFSRQKADDKDDKVDRFGYTVEQLPKENPNELTTTPTVPEEDILKDIHERFATSEMARQSLSEIIAFEQDKKDEELFERSHIYSSSVLLDAKLLRYNCLDVITFFAAVLSTSLATYQWSFQEFHIAVFSVGYLMDAVYIVRMILSFRLSFFDEVSGDLVSEISEIKNKYLSDPKGFALDFISTFPLEIFVGSMLFNKAETEKERIEHILYMKKWWVNLRINRVLRLIQVWFFFVRKTNSLRGNLVRTKLERLACFTLLYFHFLACSLHGFSQIGNFTPTENCTKSAIGRQHWACDEPQRWFQTKCSNDYKKETYAPYVWSMYFVLSTFTTTAYGDILPVSYFEMILISFIAFSSLIWFGLSMSDILSGQQTTLDTSYHLAADVVIKLYQDYGVSQPTIRKTVKYFTYAWTQNGGVIVPEFLIKAPTCLKMDICTAAYGHSLNQGYLFREMPPEFLRQVTIRLRHFWVLAGDYVIRQNEIDSNLYFIHRGYVEYTKETINEDERAIVDLGYLGRSSFFGAVQCLIGPEPHAYSYKAQVNVDVLSLSPNDFQELFELFPQHKATLMRRVLAKRKAGSSMKAIEAQYSEDTSRLISQWNLRKMMLREMDRGVYDSD